jgi:hypothetical protein
MGMIIQFTSGRRFEALLLATTANVMRVVVSSERDALDLVRAGDEWYTQSGEPVEIEGLIAIGGVDATQFCSAVEPPRAAAAGSGFGL